MIRVKFYKKNIKMAEEGHRITEVVLKKALGVKHDVHPKDVQIKSFEVTGGSNKGDNFACEMKAIKVDSVILGKAYSDCLMGKCFPMNENRVKMLKDVSKTTKVCIQSI